MSLPRPVAEVLKRHLTQEVEGIDRMYCNMDPPRLQTDFHDSRLPLGSGERTWPRPLSLSLTAFDRSGMLNANYFAIQSSGGLV